MSKQSKKILVTGGLGFIGFHLCRQLLQHDPDTELTIVDNLSSTQLDYSELLERSSIFLENFLDFEPGNQRFDEIYHLASPVGSLGILANNGYVAEQILSLAQKAASVAATSRSKLLYLSSSEVYGRDGQHGEDDKLEVPPLRGTRMEYALGKLAAEHVLFNRSLDDPFEIRVVRPFNVVGRYQSADIGFVMPTFFTNAMADEALPVFGDGQQKRSFCLVRDLVGGMLAVQASGKSGSVYNVGNPDNLVTIADLAAKVIKCCDSNSTIDFVDPVKRHGEKYLEAFEKIPDITRVRSETGWQPTCNLDTLLKELYTYHKEVSKQVNTA